VKKEKKKNDLSFINFVFFLLKKNKVFIKKNKENVLSK